MILHDVFTAKSIAANYTEDPSNKVAYIGEGFFPVKTKMGLDLKWIKAHKGLPVSLKPSNFDAKSELRTREGFKFTETEMAFFRESMLVKEIDEQEIMRVQDANDPYAKEILARIYDDANTLVAGAAVVPERMRMQLLAPENGGHPGITIASGDAQYTYNYDVDGTYATENYLAISDTDDKWDAVETADPLNDIQAALDAVEQKTGSRPEIAIMSLKTFNYLKANKRIHDAVLAQNVSANLFMTSALVKDFIKTELGVDIVVYTKQYKDEAGVAHKFYPDGFCTLVPNGALGNTWYGVTPEQRSLMGNPIANVSLIGGVAVTVTKTEDPVNTKTTVSEIVLPSYERMDETYVIKAY